MTPLIRQREFGWEGVARNDLMDDKTYHQRSNVEAMFFPLRQRFGGTLRARTWLGQFRELVLKCAVRNVELANKASNQCVQAFKHGQIVSLDCRQNNVKHVTFRQDEGE